MLIGHYIDQNITGVIEEPEKVGNIETPRTKAPADKDKINPDEDDSDFPMHDKPPEDDDDDKTLTPGFGSSANASSSSSPNASANTALSVNNTPLPPTADCLSVTSIAQPQLEPSVTAHSSSTIDALLPSDENLPKYLTPAIVSQLRAVSSAVAWQTLVNAFFEFEKAGPTVGVCSFFLILFR